MKQFSSGNKYKAIKTEIDGIVFDSKKEAARYGDLKLLERAGVINDLRVHVSFLLTVNDFHVCNYTCDFMYLEQGLRVVEDVKSKATKTRDYIIRKKLMRAIHGIEIFET